ncbi:AP-2 complex subunit mu [Diplonema papillatum]|nr:AP-2 complex subunit mu [Diplonema papillatum]
MTIGCILLLNSRGDVLCSRNYRDFYNVRAVGEAFRTQVIATKLADRSPVHNLDNVSYLFKKSENVWLVSVTKQNANAALIFQFMSKAIEIFKMYFGGVNEDIVKENHVTILELLDEIVDYGYPQITETDILKMYITNAGMKAEALKNTSGADNRAIADKLTGIIGWRKDGIRYRKNEVFIDVIEEVNVLLAQNGQALQRDVSGKIVMKSFLSGMPECKFGLNDKLMLQTDTSHAAKQQIDLEDTTFHQCVRLGKFEANRSISFVPPDGEFQLMKYRTSENVKPPFRLLHPSVKNFGKTRMEVDFRLKAEFTARVNGTNIVVKVPCPKNTASTKIKVGAGKAKYEAEHQAIVWRIRKFAGNSEVAFSAAIQLLQSTSESKTWSRPPVSLQFQVPMLATSGIHVRFLKVHEPKMAYQAVKWVRYITKAGQYECRL